MAKLERRTLELYLEYGDQNELENAILKALREIKSGIRYNREMYNTSICEWSVKSSQDGEYREEEINGVWCQVYQSKMNKEVKTKSRRHGKK